MGWIRGVGFRWAEFGFVWLSSFFSFQGTSSFHRLGHDSTQQTSQHMYPVTTTSSLVSGTPSPDPLHAYQLNQELNAPRLHGRLSFPPHRCPQRPSGDASHCDELHETDKGHKQQLFVESLAQAGPCIMYGSSSLAMWPKEPWKGKRKQVKTAVSSACSVGEDQLLTATYVCKAQCDKPGSCKDRTLGIRRGKGNKMPGIWMGRRLDPAEPSRAEPNRTKPNQTKPCRAVPWTMSACRR